MNPVSPEKVIAVGKAAAFAFRLGDRMRVRNGTLLSLWSEEFGISGTGIELRSEPASRPGKQLRIGT